MARFTSIFLGLLAALFVSATPAPSALENRDLLGEIIAALGIGLVTKINATITNPLIFELTIDSVSSIAGVNGTKYATFSYTFPKPVIVPALGTANSGEIPNVLLTQGAIASLNIISLGYLDLFNVNVNVRAPTIEGKLGIPLSIKGLHQKNVPTTYDLHLS
ncbi:hypothetical protein B0H11DRAFT_1964339 [Mycena galericulata]|nr:hypothetical protein B0H11DRAFT_1964339 [Mycena galericulata]